MTLCFSYRSAPALTLLLAAASLLPGCVDPKTIGQETDGEDSSSSDSDSDGATEGMTSQGPTTGETDTDPTAGDTDPTAGETEGPGCPPIDPAPCTECTCIDDTWSCLPSAECVSDCTGEACGVACVLCPDDDPECTEPEAEGVCTATGECVGTPPPKLGFCEGALQPGFEGDLEAVGGCADLWVYAHDAADERGLVLSIDQGLVADAVAMDMPTHTELSATDAAVQLEGRAGFFVTAAECNDAIIQDPDIKESWLPTAGTVIIDLVPTGDGFATATVELVDVELYRLQPGPAPIVVDFTFTDVGVGWLPG